MNARHLGDLAGAAAAASALLYHPIGFVIDQATESGTWAFHCHVLTHAESPDGMFGMVTALVVEP